MFRFVNGDTNSLCEHTIVLETIMQKLYVRDYDPVVVYGEALCERRQLLTHIENLLTSNVMIVHKIASSPRLAESIGGFCVNDENLRRCSAGGSIVVLVMYDVSNVDAHRIAYVDKELRRITRKSDAPFGNIMVIAFGERYIHPRDLKCFNGTIMFRPLIASPSTMYKRKIIEKDNEDYSKRQKFMIAMY
uniref:Uncharacterized protein n=1 Tax=Spodoptera litura multicapsid nucleopolyhedrovirus TaxID=46242 RepID=B0LUL5_NPVST|nr:unknown protein [Spodoptera litura nucleopolyhedrovirus]